MSETDISWDGIDSYRVPEWNPKWIQEGAKYTYVTKDLLDFPTPIFGTHRAALASALENGTAQAMEVKTRKCLNCGHEHVVDVRKKDG